MPNLPLIQELLILQSPPARGEGCNPMTMPQQEPRDATVQAPLRTQEPHPPLPEPIPFPGEPPAPDVPEPDQPRPEKPPPEPLIARSQQQIFGATH
jgi:hypothetical protein